MKKLIKYPVRVAEGQIFDADNNLIVDVRSWGRFSNMKEDTHVLHNKLSGFIKDAINEKLTGQSKITELEQKLENAKTELRFYGNNNNYHYPATKETSLTAIDLDCGMRAAKCLKKI